MQKMLVVAALNWLWGKFSGLVLYAIEKYKINEEAKKLQKDNDKQAAVVQRLADEIEQLIRLGQPVQEELKEKLREESRRLVSGPSDADWNK
jgi:predicted transcriptional regulator